MARIAIRLIILLGLNAALGWSVLRVHEATLPGYELWETDSRLLTMPEGQEFRAAFLGSSHAYLFSRFRENHAITTAALGGDVYNMAIPAGGGARPARYYFETFLGHGNRCDALVYFLDPFVLFATGPNDSHKFVWFEPFRARFLARMALDGYPHAQLIDYLRSKFGPDWLFQHPEPLIKHPGKLNEADLDPKRIRMRREHLYYQGMSDATFRRYREEVERIAARCREEGIPLVFIIPPTLLGPEPGAARVLSWLESLKEAYPIAIHDFAEAMPDPMFYYNLDHLNTEGVRVFMEAYVAPALKNSDTPA